MQAPEPSPTRRQDILRQALKRKTPFERAMFLDRACCGDAALRVEMETLLAKQGADQKGAALDGDAGSAGVDKGSTEAAPTLLDQMPMIEGPGTVIGRYKILEQIGEGGFGVVYLAEQLEPVRRPVALKIIKLGMDTRQVVARFEAERQALALMDHPNIAKVFDAGATDTGRPFFVMELVKGIPIPRYCDQEKLSTRDRLKLFMVVCQAIQHAHQKGIIHRDIKPSNILVTLQEGTPVPKVIDFGIAKGIQQRLTDKTLHTQLEQFIGTPAYMSPEQAEMSGLDIDTRSDIYSLGVLLYELLTSKTPFDPKELMSAGLDEIRRVIREKEPMRPSTRLSTMAQEELTTTTQRRGAEAPKLISLLRGDLDWIVMKCLEKTRTRRYETADGLALDIERHLKNEPVIACPPSSAYRVRKFVRRHRAGVSVAVGAVVLLAAFAVTMALQAQRIARERDRTSRERDRAERTSGFLVSLFQASDPDKAKGKALTARELIDRGLERLQVELKDEPQTRAALLHTIGCVYLALDHYDAAGAALEQALPIRRALTGRDRIDLAETLNALGHIEGRKGNWDRAEADFREALTIRRDILGNMHVKVEESLSNLRTIQWSRGRLKEAEKDFREAISVAMQAGASGKDVAKLQLNLGSVLISEDNLDAAIDVLNQSIEVLRRSLGIDNTVTLHALSNLSGALYRIGDYSQAEKIQRELLETRRRMLGNDHFDVAITLYNLGNTLDELGRFAEAEQALRESLSIWRKTLAQPHVQVAWALNDLGIVLRDDGRLDEATEAYQQALSIFEAAPSAKPVDAAWAWQGLGDVSFSKGDLVAAEKHYRATLRLRQGAPGAAPSDLAESEAALGRLVCESGSHEEGERMLRDALDIRQRILPASHWRIGYTQVLLGRCLAAERRFTDAEPLLLKGYELLRVKRGDGREETREAAGGLVALYEAWGKPDRAASYRNQAGRSAK